MPAAETVTADERHSNNTGTNTPVASKLISALLKLRLDNTCEPPEAPCCAMTDVSRCSLKPQ
eukprot:523113-Prymnesium_polylepis.2